MVGEIDGFCDVLGVDDGLLVGETEGFFVVLGVDDGLVEIDGFCDVLGVDDGQKFPSNDEEKPLSNGSSCVPFTIISPL